jgi:hypothetical protein
MNDLQDCKISEKYNEDKKVASVILSQIGKRALFMIGAKQFMVLNNGVQFHIGQNCHHINIIQVVLNGLDLYTMSFYRGMKKVSEVENIYFDQLNDMIERYTGLYTHL